MATRSFRPLYRREVVQSVRTPRKGADTTPAGREERPDPNKREQCSEFLNHDAIEGLFKRNCKTQVYYTHAYAAWEKGSVENANRIVRRWYPKGSDFSKVSRRRVATLQNDINTIHRKLLKGKTASEAYLSVA